MSGGGCSSFHFACRRSGRCCRVPDGFAFVDESELEGLAAELGLERNEFTRRHLRSVVDPSTAEPRLALRDRPDGACCLLDGDKQCTVYAARPKGCRDFPAWPSILGNQRGLERAMALCPGIEQRPAGPVRTDALAELRTLLTSAPEPSACVFPDPAESPRVTGLELELLLDAAGQTAEPNAHANCPLAAAAPPVCAVPSAAPLACRARASHSGSGRTPPPAELDFESLTAERDALEAGLPWPRRAGPLAELLRVRRDPTSIELHPQSHP